MKKIIQPDQEVHSAAEPVLPGTEQPRSLGDLLRDAEKEQAHTTQAADASATGIVGKSAGHAITAVKRGKKVSRTQSRRNARERALQALYQWDVSDGQVSQIRQQFMEEQDMSRVDVDYFTHLFNGVSHDPQTVDDALATALDRPIAELDPIERSVLRIAAFELTECPDIPARVVINEGIEITKRFGADKGHRYVNGVLDKLAASARPLEMKKR